MKKQTFTLDIAPPPAPFEGFPTEAFKFLHGLKRNNNKPWFESHRDDYEQYLREPCRQLVEVMASRIEERKLPLIANTKRSLFRINRDIRFSADKSPYKTHVGIVFPVVDLGENEWTGMYLGMEPSGSNDMKVYVGGGAYEPMPDYLKKIRKNISSKFKAFEKLLADKKFKKEFPEGIRGHSLTRAPKGYEEDDPAITYLKMKSFEFGNQLTKKELVSPSLPDLLLRKMEAGLPLLEFFKG